MISLPPSVDRVIHGWPTDRSRDWLTSFLGRAHQDENVVAVVVVGSAVRSNTRPDDLDLVVLCRDRRLLKEQAPIEVDLRSFDVERVEGELKEGQDLLAWAVRYGKPLYDADGVWAQLVERWKDDLPLPDASVAKTRAKAVLSHLEAMRAAGDTQAIEDLTVTYLTHLARAALTEAGVFPASRPELPDQLRSIGQTELSDRLSRALVERTQGRTADTLA